MSTATEVSLSRGINDHANTVNAESPTIFGQLTEIGKQKDAIRAELDGLRASELTDDQKAKLDGISGSLDQIGASVSTINESVNKIKTGGSTLFGIVPNSSEVPKVTTGTTGTGTAANPGTDAVVDDDRRGGTLGGV